MINFRETDKKSTEIPVVLISLFTLGLFGNENKMAVAQVVDVGTSFFFFLSILSSEFHLLMININWSVSVAGRSMMKVRLNRKEINR